MKNILKTFLVATFTVWVSSCNTDFLNVTPQDRFSESAVWSDPGLVQAFVDQMYRGMGHGFYQAGISSMCDEAHYVHNHGIYDVNSSSINPSNLGNWGPSRNDRDAFKWTVVYSYIRNVNIFFQNVDKVPFTDEAWRNRLKGEVHFLNAYFYHNLVRVHGGVPIVQKVFAAGDDFLVKRNTLEECVNFIVSECDLAASILPLSHSASNIGRATKGAALALKSRILLYAASELYNNPSWAGAYANPELISMSTAKSRAQRWQEAKDAAQAVMDLGIYQLQGLGGIDGTKNYTDMYMLKDTKEAILSRYFLKTRTSGQDGAAMGLNNGPNGYHNWGGNAPSQELVNDYEMADGTKFSWANPAHAATPYLNRDPRFYASILYDQAPWMPRPADAKGIDPDGKIIIRHVETSAGVWKFGLDTRKGPIEDWNGGYTGYYMRKFIDPSVVGEYNNAGGNQEVPWHFFRLGEIYLNYAEASLGLGDEAGALLYLNKIRQRAGMPDITDTGLALIDRYRNERRIEMALEEQRYFDVRRWMIAPQALGRPASGILIEVPLGQPVKYTVTSVQKRTWNDKLYFLPILQDEMNRNINLIQNPLY